MLFTNHIAESNRAPRLVQNPISIAAIFLCSLAIILNPCSAGAHSYRHHFRSHTSRYHHAAAAHHQSTKQAQEPKAPVRGNVVQAAYSMRGTRYAMGGTSRAGFDCSGFVRYILSHSGGVELPRTATEQYYHGRSIERSALQPGDLVFFKNTYRRGISHVGIYSGNGKFIHAANSHRGVQIDELGSAYYTNHYAGARRVLSADMLAMARLR